MELNAFGVLAAILLLSLAGNSFAQEAESPTAKKVEPPHITDPAVLAVLDAKPQTPAEVLESAMLLAQLGQPDLARQRLKKLIDAKLPVEALEALASALGTPAVMRLANNKALAPEAELLAKAILAADAESARNPARLRTMVAQLSAADLAQRQDATLGLLRAGSHAVEPLMAALMDPAQKAVHPEARAILVQLESDAIAPLIALTHDPAHQRLAVQLLADLRTEKAIPRLMAVLVSTQSSPEGRTAASQAIEQITGRLPDATAAKRFLEYEINRQLDRAKQIDSLDQYGGAAPKAITWIWRPDANALVSGLESTAVIARANAADAAYALATLSPTGTERLLVLTGILEASKYRSLTEQEIAFLKPFGTQAFEELLGHALKHDNVSSAMRAAEMLGRIGTPAVLATRDGTPSPLAKAANAGNRYVRFAAIEAICRLQPQAPFPGSSAVSDGLKFIAHTTGSRRALVVDPRSGAAAQIAGLLAALGYDADIATNGRDAYAMAIRSPDYEFVTIHVAIDRPRADFLVRQLRADSRTAQLPIGLIALPLHTESASRLAEAVPLSEAFAEPQNAKDVRFIAERLLSKPGCKPMPFDVRQRQAAWAVGQLTAFAKNPVPWLDARSIAKAIESSLYAHGMMPQMVDFLADAGTASGQLELVQLAAETILPPAQRELAALAFARSVQKHGILLTHDQILQQYDHYNTNAGKNKDTHKVMLIVLEAMEARREGARDEARGARDED